MLEQSGTTVVKRKMQNEEDERGSFLMLRLQRRPSGLLATTKNKAWAAFRQLVMLKT
jgi:hypothetical protein